MRLGPFEIALRRHLPPPQQKASGLQLVTQWPSSLAGWVSTVRESFAGAWQRGISTRVDDVMAHSTAWACITLIASDIGKLRIKLVQEVGEICEEVKNPSYSPVLKRPNHYQNRIKFLESWIISKLTRGNTYVLKERNDRGGEGAGNVRALYVLDPARVQVLVAPDGSVFYQLGSDDLSGISDSSIVVPASEIIHDLMSPIYHPLVGVSPIHACGRTVMGSLQIQANSQRHFANGAQLSGVLTAPNAISEPVAKRIEKFWEENFTGERNVGKVAVLGDGLKFEPMTMTAVDSQMIEQLKWGDEKVCSVFHVPPYMVGVGTAPTYNNIEALNQQYYAQCLQSLIESIELCLDEGLELKEPLYTELDLDGLLRMDSATKMDSAVKGVTGGVFMPNEARARFNLPPVDGGNQVYLQKQNWPLLLLGSDGQIPALPPAFAAPPEDSQNQVPTRMLSAMAGALLRSAQTNRAAA